MFFTPLLSGLAVFLVPGGKSTSFKLLLVFAGAYLFAITIIHILPELYHQPVGVEYIGIFVLIGFFLQQVLEYFTAGIEHGHMHRHTPPGQRGHPYHTHTHQSISAIVLLMALCIHAFLEGGMLAQSTTIDVSYDVYAILLGIALHRAPAAFALMTVLTHKLGARMRAIPYLVGFSLAAPLGLLISTLLAEYEILTGEGMIFLYAVVCGNFLHISTTIVFESSPEHRFNPKKLTVAMAGSLVAVLVEYGLM